MICKCFDKISSGGAATSANKFAVKSENLSCQQLAEGLDKPIIRKFEKRKVYSLLKTIVRVLIFRCLADTQLVSKFKEGFCFSLCVIDIYSKYTWIVPLKDKNVLKCLCKMS